MWEILDRYPKEKVLLAILGYLRCGYLPRRPWVGTGAPDLKQAV